MAKLFYTLEEASAKLNKSTEEITGLVAQGKLREFRDHEDKLMFKVEEVDLIAGDSTDNFKLDLSVEMPADSDSFELDLSGSGESPLAASGKGDSPVGLKSVEAPKDEPFGLDLELDDAPATKAPAKPEPARGAKAAKGSEEQTFELDLGASGSVAAAAGASASRSSITPPPQSAHDEMTLELDLGDEPAPARSAPAKSSSRSALDDSLGSIAAAPAATAEEALSLEGSAGGGAKGAMDSDVGSSVSDGLGIEGPGSGSGLLDLTSDSESSSIGAALMDEAFSSDEGAEMPANASGIFGGEGGESAAGLAGVAGAAAGAAVAVAATRGASAPIFTSGPAAPEVYSGSWSGLGVGLLLPCFIALVATFSMVLMKTLGAPPEIAIMYAQDWMTWTGGLAGAIVVCGAIGFFVGKATE